MIATRSRRAAVALALAAALLCCGCGEAKKPKVDAATERAEALERAKKGPYGTQVKALETAKGMSDDINKKASDSVDKAEKDAK